MASIVFTITRVWWMFLLLSLSPSSQSSADSKPSSDVRLPSDDECHKRFGNHTLTWISESAMFDKFPPHLISFPGGGSSWLRQLLEFSTGFHSGSIDTFDFEYLSEGKFAGERACGLRMCALRAHPQHFDFLQGKLRFRHHFIRDKCKRGLIREMKRLVFLVRNPFDTVWSYYQLLYTLKHSDYLTEDSFDAAGWKFFGPYIAKLQNQEFYRIVLPAMTSYPQSDVHILKYENLLGGINPQPGDKGINSGVAELRKLMNFMGYAPSDERLQCAFRLADMSAFGHRRMDDIKRVTALQAYFTPSSSEKSSGRSSTLNSDVGSSGEAELPLRSTYSRSFAHFICEMREHLQDMAMQFNYTSLPSPVPLDRLKSEKGLLPIEFDSVEEYVNAHFGICEEHRNIALSAWPRVSQQQQQQQQQRDHTQLSFTEQRQQQLRLMQLHQTEG